MSLLIEMCLDIKKKGQIHRCVFLLCFFCPKFQTLLRLSLRFSKQPKNGNSVFFSDLVAYFCLVCLNTHRSLLSYSLAMCSLLVVSMVTTETQGATGCCTAALVGEKVIPTRTAARPHYRRNLKAWTEGFSVNRVRIKHPVWSNVAEGNYGIFY